jgi:hypothetical protein
MPSLPASSPSSAPSLRLELRPSRVLAAALIVLAALATLAVLRSNLPVLSVLGMPILLALALWQLQRAPRGLLVLLPGGEARWVPRGSDEWRSLDSLSLQRRGPLCVLSLGVQGRCVRWPGASDTLPSADARLLRLWLDRHRPAEPVAPSDAVPTSQQGPA